MDVGKEMEVRMKVILSGLMGGDTAAADEESTEPSRVIDFHLSHRWQLHFNESKKLNKLMAVDFTGTWCGPCKLMALAFEAMANKYTDVDFVKIDVDELSEFGVKAMPTFLLLKHGKEIDTVIGAKKDELEKKILKNREVPKFAA